MATTADRRVALTGTRVLLPFRHMNWQNATAGLAGAFVPASVTAFTLALVGGNLRPITTVVLATIAVVAFCAWRIICCRIALDRDGLRRWGLVQHGRRVPRAAVKAAITVPLFNEERLESNRQLFLVDERSRTLVRMNGLWWSDDQMAAVAAHFEVPLETIPEMMTIRELRRTRAVHLQWWERHPAIGFLAAATVISGGCAVIGLATTASLHGR